MKEIGIEEVRGAALENGAAVVRSLPIGSAEGLHSLLRSIGVEPVAYRFGQSPRTRLYRRVYTASEYPAQHEVPLHHELSYLPDPPQLIFFFAELPGTILIGDGAAIAERIGSEICSVFQRRGVRYRKRMHAGVGPGKSWQQHFETTDRDEVEIFLRDCGARFEWRAGELAVEIDRPAMVDRIWFNQVTLWHGRDPLHATFADGGEIPGQMIAEISRALEACAIEVPLGRADLLALDNRLIAHGRRAFSGERRILVAMA
jgi:alpha-ketoglutarate-dependent taurine dioxygenase